jgi:Flp pilus assembly protein TadD
MGPTRISVGRLLCFLLVTITMANLTGAQDKAIRIPLPKRSKPTPVQRYNREGVVALEKHNYKKAGQLFYQAYLLDPDDPFTLNNLGYMAELEGDIDRAQRYYDLAAEHATDAMVDLTTEKSLKGKSAAAVAGYTEDVGLEVNRLNIQAISLMRKDRAAEADDILSEALKLNPQSPFTLNNMGFAKEKEGDYESAMAYYRAAANLHSDELVVVAINSKWRGRKISEVAAENEDKLNKLMVTRNDIESRVAQLNTEGVSALNRNDRKQARGFLEQAYKLDPEDAFTLNNMGYLAEIDGDQETAQYYYERARDAKHNDSKVMLATRRGAEGEKIGSVADQGDSDVDERMQAEQRAKQAQGGAIVLKRRDNQPVTEDLQQQPVPLPPLTNVPPPTGR